ncbi:MAG: FHA domain-containing protein, partial [Proteobacteria bacterium]|nr:FHA domain-containing protein [Pseudomonadota bacterium]
MGKLVLYLEDGRTRTIPLGADRIVIGRRMDNDVCLPFPAVSGEHAAVVTILLDSFLEDLGSTNGTLVNGKPITKHFLRDHDEIDIGRQRLVYFAEDSAPVDVKSAFALRTQARMFGDQVERIEPSLRER